MVWDQMEQIKGLYDLLADLTPAETALCIALLAEADDDGCAALDVQEVARKTGYSQRSLWSALARLKSAGVVQIASRGARGRKTILRLTATNNLKPVSLKSVSVKSISVKPVSVKSASVNRKNDAGILQDTANGLKPASENPPSPITGNKHDLGKTCDTPLANDTHLVSVTLNNPPLYPPLNQGDDQPPAGGQGQDKPTRARRGRKATVDWPAIPAELDVPEFRAAWEQFAQHRQEIGHKLTPTSARLLLAKCRRWGARAAVEAIKTSIENGWRGVFEPMARDRPPQAEALPWGDGQGEIRGPTPEKEAEIDREALMALIEEPELNREYIARLERDGWTLEKLKELAGMASQSSPQTPQAA